MSTHEQSLDEAGAPEALAVDDLLCFALYAASRAMTARYRPLLEPLGLTYPQYLVLVALYEHRRLSVQQLGDKLRLDSGTLSPLLRRLADNDFVTRTRSTADERSVVIALTPKARRLRPRVAAVHARMCDAIADFHTDTIADDLRALTTALGSSPPPAP